MTDAIKTDGRGPYYQQDPRERLPLSVDWGAWLTQENTTIDASVWAADDGGITLASPTYAGAVTQVVVSGGVSGTVYTLRNTITCANGSIGSRSIRVMIRPR